MLCTITSIPIKLNFADFVVRLFWIMCHAISIIAGRGSRQYKNGYFRVIYIRWKKSLVMLMMSYMNTLKNIKMIIKLFREKRMWIIWSLKINLHIIMWFMVEIRMKKKNILRKLIRKKINICKWISLPFWKKNMINSTAILAH